MSKPSTTPAAKNDSDFTILTVDIGSSSIRANLYTQAAAHVEGAETKVAYSPTLTEDGGVEIDPATLLADVVEAIDGTLSKADDKTVVRGVGFCSLVSNLIGIGKNSRPTTPIYTWADTRSAPEAKELRDKLDVEAVRDRTGCPIHSSYLPARLLWLEKARPKEFAATAKWISLGEWVGLNLLGETGQTFSVASWGGLLNRHTLEWDEDLLRFLKLDVSNLPRLVDYNAPLTGLKDEYAKRWPRLRDIPWYPCAADGVTGNLGCGCVSPRDIAVQVGTSGAMRAVMPGSPEAIPEGLWCYRVDRESSLVGGALSEGGNLTAWLRDTLRHDDFEEMEKEAARLAPDSHGLTVLPFIAGERSPGWRGQARATFSGISLNTKPPHLLRAAEEAVAYRFGFIFDALRQVLPEVKTVVASGGALLNAEGWMEILADTLGEPIIASGEEQASSRGIALLALRAAGVIPSYSALPAALGRTYKPNMKHHKIYRTAMHRQQELYETIGDSMNHQDAKR